MRLAALLVLMTMLVGFQRPCLAGAEKKRAPGAPELLGTWRGEKGAVKAEVVFKAGLDVHWTVVSRMSKQTVSASADLTRVEDKKTGAVLLRADYTYHADNPKRKRGSAFLGRIERVADGSLRLTITPPELFADSYLPVEGLILRQAKGLSEPAQLLPPPANPANSG